MIFIPGYNLSHFDYQRTIAGPNQHLKTCIIFQTHRSNEKAFYTKQLTINVKFRDQ